jgi:hypothetical protein
MSFQPGLNFKVQPTCSKYLASVGNSGSSDIRCEEPYEVAPHSLGVAISVK